MLPFSNFTHNQTDKHLLKSESILTRVDARARILVFVLFASVSALSSHILALLFMLFVALIFAFLAKLAIKSTLKKVLAMDAFIIMLVVMLPFTTAPTTTSDVLFTVLDFTASQTGLNKATSILLIANSVILFAFALVGHQDPHTLGLALLRLKVPTKLIHLMFFSLRYMEVIHKEYLRMRQAMKVRGFSLQTNWHTWRSIGYLVGMLLIRSLERSQRIHHAMLCRGFDSQEGRGLLLVDQDTLNWQVTDSIFLVCLSILAALLFLYELML